MSTRRKPGHRGRGNSRSSLVDGLSRLSRYDLLLVVIPLGFALSLSGHLALSIPLHQAFLAGAVLGLLALVDALFLNPPAESPPDDSFSD